MGSKAKWMEIWCEQGELTKATTKLLSKRTYSCHDTLQKGILPSQHRKTKGCYPFTNQHETAPSQPTVKLPHSVSGVSLGGKHTSPPTQTHEVILGRPGHVQNSGFLFLNCWVRSQALFHNEINAWKENSDVYQCTMARPPSIMN